MTDLTIDGETFRVEVEGAPDRPSVLLSSSLGADLTLWDAQMQVLLEHFRVVRYDPRGHGRTTALGAPFSIERLGADAIAILDALAIETAHFVGISMGGAVGQWLLVNAPDRISRAVLANTSPRFGTPDVWNARIAAVLAGGVESLAAATMERWFSEDFRTAQAERVAAVEATFRATSPEGYAACCAALRDMDMREALRAVERPVLIVTGRDDPVASEADIAAMTGAIHGARDVALDCRHISNIEAATAFNAAIVAFLTERTATRAARPRPPRKHAAPTRRPTTGRATAARRPLKAVAPATTAKPRARKPATAPSAVAVEKGAKRTATKRTPAKAATKKPRTVATPAARKAAPARKVAAKKVAAKKAATSRTSTTRKPAATKRSATPKRPSATGKRPATKRGAPRKATTTRRRPGKGPGRPGGGRRKR